MTVQPGVLTQQQTFANQEKRELEEKIVAALKAGVLTAVDLVGLRIQAMPSQIAVGAQFPDISLSRLVKNPNTGDSYVVHFNTFHEVAQGKSVIYFFPKAFTPVCTQTHLPSLVKAADVFASLKIKVFGVAVNTRDEMFHWQQAHDLFSTVKMIPDYLGQLTEGVGLGMDKCVTRNLGFVAQRGGIFVEDGVVKYVTVEPDSSRCVQTDPEELLKTLVKLGLVQENKV